MSFFVLLILDGSLVIVMLFMHHSYGATEVMDEGAPDFPDASRMGYFTKYKVTIFYTTLHFECLWNLEMTSQIHLTCQRWDYLELLVNQLILKFGNGYKTIKKNAQSLTHGGKLKLEVCWFLLPGIETILQPGSGTRAIPGVNISVVDENGTDVAPNTKGYLYKEPWPGMLLTLWNDDENTKLSTGQNMKTGTILGIALKDNDGYLWLLVVLMMFWKCLVIELELQN